MPAIKVTHEEAKYMTSRIYELCHRLYGKEFMDVYDKSKLVFTYWLNKKTGLSENLILDAHNAVLNWHDKLEQIYKKTLES